MQVRRATIEDARRIAEIHVRSWQAAYRGIMPDSVLDSLSVEKRRQFWAEQLAGDSRETLVTADAGGVVGWISYGPCRDVEAHADAPGEGEVYGIYLDPSAYRKGFGRMLWAAATCALAARGCRRVVVWVLEANTPARRFYEAMGGELDPAGFKDFVAEGLRLPHLRYHCPVRLGAT